MYTTVYNTMVYIPTWEKSSHYRNDINREEYERNLKRRQKEHLDSIQKHPWQPCLHDGCPDCVGTGIKRDGSICVHHISCSCPKCSPTC